MESDFAARLLAEVRRCPTASSGESRLAPLREVVLTLRAKRISYEKIAALLRQRGVQIEQSAVGEFCRRHCPPAELERVRRDLMAAPSGTPAPGPTQPAPPDSFSLSPGKRRNPRIARDDL